MATIIDNKVWESAFGFDLNVLYWIRIENQIYCREFLGCQDSKLIHSHIVCSVWITVVIVDCQQIVVKNYPPIVYIEGDQFADSNWFPILMEKFLKSHLINRTWVCYRFRSKLLTLWRVLRMQKNKEKRYQKYLTHKKYNFVIW